MLMTIKMSITSKMSVFLPAKLSLFMVILFLALRLLVLLPPELLSLIFLPPVLPLLVFLPLMPSFPILLLPILSFVIFLFRFFVLLFILILLLFFLYLYFPFPAFLDLVVSLTKILIPISTILFSSPPF